MTAVGEAPAIASTGIRAHLVIRLTELGIRDAEEQRNVVERWTRGRTRRRSELTQGEAESLARRLRSITPGEIAAVARPTGPAPRVDAEPAPEQRTLDPSACLASWDKPAPGGQGGATGSPGQDTGVAGVVAHDVPMPSHPRPGLPAEDVVAFRRFGVELDERRRPDPVAIAAEAAVASLLPPADVVDVVEPAPPVEPAPAREPGQNPAWPHPDAEGWTGPTMVNGLPNPSGLGPYCMSPPGTCYCGSCPHYMPLPEINSPEYKAQVRRALREASEKNDRRRGRP